MKHFGDNSPKAKHVKRFQSLKHCWKWAFAFAIFVACVILYKQCSYISLRPALKCSSCEISRLKRRSVTLSHNTKASDVLKFPKDYHATGVLRLPYGDIIEPFEVWYSRNNKMSRIDYYGGMDITFQREDIGEYGFAAKVVPEYSEKSQKTFKGCLHKVGSKHFPIKAQSIVPDPIYFKYFGNTTINGTKCSVWKHSFMVMNKRNEYTLYTSQENPPKPVKYEMMGYDTLLTSYYDHYVLDYTKFEPWDFDFSMFEIPSELKCFDFPSLGTPAESLSSFSPMFEFVPHQHQLLETESNGMKQDDLPGSVGEDSMDIMKTLNKPVKPHYENIVDVLFSSFKKTYRKKYDSKDEHEKRKDIFRHNMRFVNALNRQHLSYKLKLNKFADMTDKEVDRYKGLLNEPEETYNGGKKLHVPDIDFSSTPIPEMLDWREYGAVNKVHSQGICGSCYAYAVTGAIEGAYYLKTGSLLDLSEQQIVDCTWGFGNRGCKGGYPSRAMKWIMKHGGLATERSYGRYLAQEGYCHFKNATIGAEIESYMNVTKGNKTELKLALAMYGPVTILINTRPKSFKFYSSGVYYDNNCDTSLDHAALAVGFGVEKTQEYWLIKNSWSTSWGDEGYIKISTKNDNCGVTQKAVVAKVKVK